MLTHLSQRRDMGRSESLRADHGERTHRIFRPSELIHGEVLGKGFFGQAVKVQNNAKNNGFYNIILEMSNSYEATLFLR